MAGESKDELDITSPSFNPLSALYSDSVSIPYPNATTYDNVAVYESSLKRESRSSKATTSTVGSSATGQTSNTEQRAIRHPVSANVQPRYRSDSERIEKLMSLCIKPIVQKQTTRRQKNIFNTLNEGYKKGPLSLLTRCMNDRLVVKVCTRNRREIRGWCRGYIEAFDKHMNLAMVDVDETYRNPLWLSKSARRRRRKLQESQKLNQAADVGTTEEIQKKSGLAATDDKLPQTTTSLSVKSLNIGYTKLKDDDKPKNHLSVPKELTRHLNKLFIRGDTVVTVIPIK